MAKKITPADDGIRAAEQEKAAALRPAETPDISVKMCALKEPLSDPELVTLKDYLIGQAADGWGEGFEQQDIKVGDGAVLNVHLWNSGKNWQMMTEAEFAQRFEQAQAMDTMSY